MQTITMDQVKSVKGRGFLHNKFTDTFSARVVTKNGLVTAAQTKALAEISEKYGNGMVTLTTRQGFELQGVPFSKIDEFTAAVEAAGLLVGGTGPKVRPVVACKGTTCPCGIIDTFSLAGKIYERFYRGWHDVKLPGKFKIAVGGCPNNCVKPDLNDVGIVGCVLPGRKRGYRILLGGHWGRTGGVGKEAVVLETEDAVLLHLEKILTFYRDNGQPGERYFKTIARLGKTGI